MSETLWRPAPDYETTYEVSTDGRVRSKLTGQELKPQMRGRYYAVKLYTPGTGVFRRFSIHRLMGLTFLPNPEGLPVVRHLDDQKTNNVISNLAWGTHQQNSLDAVRNKSWPVNRRTMCVKGLHKMTPENTRITRGTRNGRQFEWHVCRACILARDPARYDREAERLGRRRIRRPKRGE